MTNLTNQIVEEAKKRFDVIADECFSSDFKKLKYHTWKFKEKALKDFLETEIRNAVDRVISSFTDLKSSEEWTKDPEFSKYKILDPDGWDRSNFEQSWSEKIDRREFARRLMLSTLIQPKENI